MAHLVLHNRRLLRGVRSHYSVVLPMALGNPQGARIATLLPFPLSEPGGVSTFIIGLAEALELGFDAELRLIAPDRFRGDSGQRFAQLALATELFLGLYDVRPNVVHTHQHPVLLAAALAYRALTGPGRARIVHTVHVDPAEPTSLWKRAVLGWLLARCSAVTAVSENTAWALGRVATPVPHFVHVIRGATGIRPRGRNDKEVARFRDAYGLEAAFPIVCQVSPLNFPLKVAGIQRLIHGFALVQQRFPGARLLLVGDGVLRVHVEATCAEAGVTDAVILTGYVNDVSVPLALTDVYCHITLQDACPLSLVEAMRCGKPIVAARTGGIPEIIVDGCDGLLVHPTPSAVARAILTLLDDPERAQQLGRHAAQTALQRFSWDRAAAEFAPLYGLAEYSSVCR